VSPMFRRLDVRLAALTAAIVAAGALVAGQDPQQPTPTFRTSVEAVQLSVTVTDASGNLVSGLKEEDFEILENKVARPITTFAGVNIPIERIERTGTKSDVVSNDVPVSRVYVIALDAMSANSALRARHFLRQFVEQHFGPNDSAAVVLTTRGPRDSGQEFTSDPQLLLNAIDKFGGDGVSVTEEWAPRMRERNFAGDFKALMQYMATLRTGRKAIIYMSEGFPLDAFDVVDQQPSWFGLFSGTEPDFVDALSIATRNNIAVYPVDPRGLTTETTEAESFSTESLDTRTRMSALADVTGGFALVGSNNYNTAFERIVRENSTYYILGFNSAVQKPNGRFVGVDVRVKRPDLRVRSYDGYVSQRERRQPDQSRPNSVLPGVWDAVSSAIATSGVPMRVSAAPFKGKGKDATIPITLEIAPNRLNLVEENGAYRGVLEVVFVITDASKKTWPIWRHRASLALKPDTYERVNKGALRVLSQLTLPKGRYQIRASAGSVGAAGSVVYDLQVPDFRQDFALSGVALTSAQTRQTFTFMPHKQIDVGLPGPPTTVREFSRDDVVTLFAEAYENREKPHAVTLTFEVRDETGKVHGRAVMERKAPAKPKGTSAYVFSPTLTLEDVPPGRYSVHLTARSSLDSGKSETREIPFSVR
jgi:VWFA-related protein